MPYDVAATSKRDVEKTAFVSTFRSKLESSKIGAEGLGKRLYFETGQFKLVDAKSVLKFETKTF